MMHNMDLLIKLLGTGSGNGLLIIIRLLLFESVPLGVKSSQS